ncbi:hypothetical protein HLH17_06930 [Acinetobacter sp. ANC 5380]|uniref:Uncharacterized protein n=1 Tax=Acinetobacter terrae TaxID=2731247 RepID=A0A7Y2WAL2_9GAMM|nr:hypothetical protein [Acinetobacter terrae]NNH77407.1 hypothetical protein [Acinetobacter terrae]
MRNNFHISKVKLKVSDIANLKGFSPDLHECLMNLGFKQNIERVLDAEFIVNMGVMCTSLAIMATDKKVSQDWRFSEHGLIYVINTDQSFDVFSKHGEKFTFNHTEFSLLIGIMACRESIIGALINRHLNPFRISIFYENFLHECMSKVPPEHMDHQKVSAFLQEHKRTEYADHEPYFIQYLSAKIEENA